MAEDVLEETVADSFPAAAHLLRLEADTPRTTAALPILPPLFAITSKTFCFFSSEIVGTAEFEDEKGEGPTIERKFLLDRREVPEQALFVMRISIVSH